MHCATRSLRGCVSTVDAAGSPAVCLATVLVGNDGPSQRYVGSKHKKAVEAGFQARHVDLPETATQDEVEAVVRELAADDSVHGILVQLPLPTAWTQSLYSTSFPQTKTSMG